MKFFTATLLATVLALALANPSHKVQDKELDEEAQKFIECLRQALDGGDASIDLPNHNPLTINETMDIQTPEIIGISANVTVKNCVMMNITRFPTPTLTGVKTDNGANFTYEFIWTDMIIKCDWNGTIKDIFGSRKRNGSASATLLELHLTGKFDTTLESGGTGVGTLLTFVVQPTCKSATVNIKGVSIIIDGPLSIALTDMLTPFFNDKFPMVEVSKNLQDILNKRWMSNSTRIERILDQCQPPPFE